MFGVNKNKVLLVKYLLGEATPEEQKLAEDYIARSERNKQLFESYRGLMFLTQKKRVEYNADQAWEKVRNRIEAKNGKNNNSSLLSKTSKRLPLIRYAVSAAAALLIVLIGFVKFISRDDVTINKISSGLAVAAPYELPDGSDVILNSSTTLKFPEKFEKDIREVSIFGEAFFEINPDPDRPFIIHANGMDIKVLGTSFNVEAYPGNDYVKVTVNTGKVTVYPTGTAEADIQEEGQFLTAGEVVTYSHKTGVFFKSVNDDLNVLSWKTGILTFKEARLAEVLKAFEEKYHKQFVIDDSTLLDQRLTARFENESLDDALETLSLIFNVKFENKERHIIVH
ncbi:MAG TPA: FecR domain-containing protein [Lentimicrobium sp.]|nr:FecR domain-containing protein [Lentimicrobium sp.]